MSSSYDLIIVGGGMVGAGLALALAQSNLKIALVDARLPSPDDPRLFALNYSSCQFLKNLGLWDALSPHAAMIAGVHVSWQGHFGGVKLGRDDVQLPELGFVIPAYHIETAVYAALAKLQTEGRIHCYRPAKLQSLQQQSESTRITLATQDGEVQLSAPIIIGADGTESTVRTQLKMETEIVDYEQSAIVVRTRLKRSHQHIAYERFNAHGAIAMLPLINNECATIWSADNATCTHLMSLSAADFLQALQTEFGYKLGRLESVSERHCFPLRMVRAKKMVEQNVFLLGNAAHTLHPVAAQGFNLALYEVALLADAFTNAQLKQESLTLADLQRISQLAQSQQTTSIGMSHRLPDLFTEPSLLKSMALQMGMLSLDVISPVKKILLKKMLGRAGRVPSLLLSMDTP